MQNFDFLIFINDDVMPKFCESRWTTINRTMRNSRQHKWNNWRKYAARTTIRKKRKKQLKKV